MSTVPGLLVRYDHGAGSGGRTIAYGVSSDIDDIQRDDVLTGLREVIIVAFDGVTRVRVAMKFTSAKLASLAGTTRCNEISYAW